MGSYLFQALGEGQDAKTAFQAAVEEAHFEHGHGGYTGTIAEKDDFVVVAHSPMSYEDAARLAEQLVADEDERISDKWGPAGAIPVVRNAEPTRTHDRTLRVRVPRDPGARRAAIQAAITASLEGDEVAVSWRETGRTRGRTTTVSGRTRLRATTRYAVIFDNRPNALPVWDASYETIQEALEEGRRWASATMDDDDGCRDEVALAVVGVTRREDGAPLARVVVSAEPDDVEVTVAVGRPTDIVGAPPDSWLFFGWASS